jgi:hypothetical protein
MADLDTNAAILIAAIGAFSGIAGGLISSIANYLIEKQRSKKEAIKVQREEEIRETELRNQAYIGFLIISENQVFSTNEDLVEEFHPEYVEESVALIITHGSPMIASLVVHAYPFMSWDELDKTKRFIMMELLKEKDNMQLYSLATALSAETDD